MRLASERDSGAKGAGAAEGNPAPAGFKSIFRLFFGGSFFGVTLMTLAGLFPVWLAILVSIVGLLMIARVLERNGRELPKFRWVLLLSIAFGAIFVIFQGLATLSSGGVYGVDNSSQNAFEVEKDMLIAAGWLVLGIPHRAFRIRLDRDGDGYAQRVLLKLLVAIASALTGVAILLLHFGNGPLKSVDGRALFVGTIFTVVLIAPIYMSAARRCWQLGIQNLSPKHVILSWNKALTELDQAFYRQSKSDLTPSDHSLETAHKASRDKTARPGFRPKSDPEKASPIPAAAGTARRRTKKSVAKGRRHR